MKLSLLLYSLVASACAAPAVVWKKQGEQSVQRVLHSSDDVSVSALLGDAITGTSFAVVFLVGKDENGRESLSELASSGKLPATAEKYGSADGVYHHVSGIESSGAVVREAAAHTDEKVLSISMSELHRKLNSLSSKAEMEVTIDGSEPHKTTSSKAANKRARQLESANVLIVNIDPKDDAAEIDRTIASTIENDKVNSVVLAGVRSLQEVKRERMLASQRRQSIMQKAGERVLEARRRRRLEDQADAEDGSSDMSGVYYVAMTPNILAALLFMGLFTTIAWIGISCMGAISGQDVFVTKMPSVGREA